MSFKEQKFEIAILTLVVVLVGGLGYLVKEPVQAVIASAEIIYEMPRPKSFFAALFNLDDREISRTYVNPFAKKKKDDKKKDAKLAKKDVKPTAVAAAKKPEAKKADDANKPKVSVDVVGADKSKGVGTNMAALGGSGGGNESAGAAAAAGGGNNSPAADETTNNKMAADQWISLILAQPTKDNVAKLVAAYMAKEVDDATFYTIVGDLLKNNKADTQQMGLYAISSIYSTQSFSVVSDHYDQMTADTQSKAQAYLTSFATNGRLGVLKSALQSSDASTVEMAAQVVIKGYQSAKAGTTGTLDPRNSRGNVNSTSVSGYSQFVPIFQQLAQSKDSAIVALANSALSQIQTGVAAL